MDDLLPKFLIVVAIAGFAFCGVGAFEQWHSQRGNVEARDAAAFASADKVPDLLDEMEWWYGGPQERMARAARKRQERIAKVAEEWINTR